MPLLGPVLSKSHFHNCIHSSVLRVVTAVLDARDEAVDRREHLNVDV